MTATSSFLMVTLRLLLKDVHVYTQLSKISTETPSCLRSYTQSTDWLILTERMNIISFQYENECNWAVFHKGMMKLNNTKESPITYGTEQQLAFILT